MQAPSATVKRRPFLLLGVALLSFLCFYLLCVYVNGISRFGNTELFDTHNTHDTYTLQAERWWQGHIDLGQFYEHLEIAEYNGKFYCSFPPVPSVPLFFISPFFRTTAADGTTVSNTPDRLLGFLYLLIGCCLLALFLRRRMDEGSAVFWAFFAGMGCNLMAISVYGGIWFMAQTMAFMLTCASLWAIDSPKPTHWPWAFTFWALAVGCRPLQAVYLPILLWFLARNQRLPWRDLVDKLRSMPRWQLLKKTVWLFWMPTLIALALMVYNAVRFGNPLEFGHTYLSEMQKAPHGQFSTYYAFVKGEGVSTSNLLAALRLPAIHNGRLVFPNFNGFNLLLANPIFIAAYGSLLVPYAAFVNRRRAKDMPADPTPTDTTPERPPIPLSMVMTTLALCTLHMLLLLCHNTNGGWHFGLRYFCDTIPFITLLLFARHRTQPTVADKLLCAFAVALQVYGAAGWLSKSWP